MLSRDSFLLVYYVLHVEFDHLFRIDAAHVFVAELVLPQIFLVAAFPISFQLDPRLSLDLAVNLHSGRQAVRVASLIGPIIVGAVLTLRVIKHYRKI
ncbi:hypothetical protein GGR55DRAFT_650877 [Xylaria sp. FL0064]|nr:hypothetical protein GGR55DRAFT_650877 [Xylaria sp. FL0064]